MTDNLETFLDRADKAMYLAKSTGRNRVCSAEVPEIEPIPMSLEVRNDSSAAMQNAS
jgi:predicted signal transduction protein with EAL and GGDEF domain